MRFVIFGLTVSSSWGNGHATIWRGLCNALAASGHSIVFYEKDVPYYRNHRDLISPSNYSVILYEDWDQVQPVVRNTLAAADCAIVTSYCPDARAASDLILASKVRKVFYDLDTPVTLSELNRQGDVDYLPPYGLQAFDLVLSYTGGKALDELKTRLRARRVASLYGSVDPALHKRTQENPCFASDFSYLGTYAPDRQARLDELFLKPAKKLSQRKFCIGGAMYPADFPWTANTYFVHHLAPPDHPAFYSSSRLTLNVTRAAMTQMGYCPSGRLFEAAACGTPIVSDWWDGLDHFFQPGEEILIAKDAEDAIEAINLTDSELQRLSSASQERVLAEHTAANRAAELVRLVEAIA
jgi:spore maturation protein CgeB